MKKIKNIFNYVARKELRDISNRPVKIINGTMAPVWAGHGYRWETRGGTIINYPNTYSKNGWSNMIYVHSTIHILVGKDWLINTINNKYPQYIGHLFK